MKKILLLIIFFTSFHLVSAETTIPESLNQCLKLEISGGYDNFIFSPNGKNFAYTIGKSIYKNGQKIDTLQDFMEIKGISFKNDNNTIMVYVNGVFSKTQYQKYGTNYNTSGFIIDYPTNTDWINKKYGEIVKFKTSNDGKSWAILNDYYSVSENKNYLFIVKDDKEIGPLGITDFGYNEDGTFYYEHITDGKHCINNNGVEKCDENYIKTFNDAKYEEFKNSSIPVYFGKDNVSKYFKINNTEVGSFNILDSSNIILSKDSSKFGFNAIQNNLIICDKDLKSPTDLIFTNNKDKIEKSKTLYSYSNLENYSFLDKIPYNFQGDILEFIKNVQEKIVNEEIIKIYQKGTDTLIITKSISKNGDKYSINLYKNFKKESYGFSQEYLNLSYAEKKYDYNEYQDIILSDNLDKIAIIVKYDGKTDLLVNGKTIKSENDIWNINFSNDGNKISFLTRTNDNETSYVVYDGKQLIEINITNNFSDPKIDSNQNLYYISGNTIYKNNKEIFKSNSDISYYKVDDIGNVVYKDKNNVLYLNNKIFFDTKNGNNYFATIDLDMNNIINIFYDKNEKYQISNNGVLIDKNKYDFINNNAFLNNGIIYYIVKKDNKNYLYANGKQIISDDFEGIDVFSYGMPIITHKDGFYTIYVFINGELNKIAINEITQSKNGYMSVNTYGNNVIFIEKDYEGSVNKVGLVKINNLSSNISNKDSSQENIDSEKNTNIISSKDKTEYTKQKILSMVKLKKVKQEKYINKIDKIVSGTNKEKLEQIFNKIQKLKKKNNVIEYLEAEIYLELNK